MALKIKVMKKATKIKNCGGVEYQVRWILDPGDNGYVVQRVDFGHEVLKCDKTADPDLTGTKSFPETTHQPITKPGALKMGRCLSALERIRTMRIRLC
jgi:hypothetical protein